MDRHVEKASSRNCRPRCFVLPLTSIFLGSSSYPRGRIWCPSLAAGKERGGQNHGQSFQIGALTTPPLPPPACLADTPAAPDPTGSDGKTIRQAALALERVRTDEARVPSLWWFEVRNTLVVSERQDA